MPDILNFNHVLLFLTYFQSCKRIKTFQVGCNPCLSLHITGQYLITQDKTCTLKVWRLTDKFDLVLCKEFNNISFCRICILEGSTTYIGIPQPNSQVEICIFSSKQLKLFRCCRFPDENVKLGEVLHLKLFYIESHPYLAVVYESGMLIVWDFCDNVLMYDKITNDTPMAFDFDSINLQGICGTASKKITVFKFDNKWNIVKQKVLEIKNSGTGCLRIRPDRKIVAAGCWDGRIRIFSWKSCKLLAVLNYHTESILDLYFSNFTISTWHSKHLLVAVASDKRISLWNIYN